MTGSGLVRRTIARHPAQLGLAAVAMAAVTWSLGAIGAGVLLERGVDPGELAQSRVLLTALGFGAVNLAVRAPARHRRLPPAHLLAFGAAVALVMVLILLAIGRLGVAVGTVLHYTAPLLVVMWGVVASRRAPSPIVIASAAASVVGVILVSGALTAGVDGIDTVGLAFGFLSATAFATYTVLAERVIWAYGPVNGLLRGFGLAAVGWVIYQLPRGWPADLFAPANFGLVVFIGVLGTWLPFLLFLWGIERVRAERAAIAATLEPVISAVIAWALLGQVLAPLQVVGAAVILAAVVSLQVSGARPAELRPDVAQRTVSRYQSP